MVLGYSAQVVNQFQNIESDFGQSLISCIQDAVKFQLPDHGQMFYDRSESNFIAYYMQYISELKMPFATTVLEFEIPIEGEAISTTGNRKAIPVALLCKQGSSDIDCIVLAKINEWDEWTILNQDSFNIAGQWGNLQFNLPRVMLGDYAKTKLARDIFIYCAKTLFELIAITHCSNGKIADAGAPLLGYKELLLTSREYIKRGAVLQSKQGNIWVNGWSDNRDIYSDFTMMSAESC